MRKFQHGLREQVVTETVRSRGMKTMDPRAQARRAGVPDGQHLVGLGEDSTELYFTPCSTFLWV